MSSWIETANVPMLNYEHYHQLILESFWQKNREFPEIEPEENPMKGWFTLKAILCLIYQPTNEPSKFNNNDMVRLEQRIEKLTAWQLQEGF